MQEWHVIGFKPKEFANSEPIVSITNFRVHIFQLDSDQDSTDGEDEGSSHSRCGQDVTKAKSSATLTPHNLLYTAARVHNLPVMSHALAMGADTNWRNSEKVLVR